MKLSSLAQAAHEYVLNLTEDCEVSALLADSRQPSTNGLFFCIVGNKVDGHDYAAQAVKNGATALVVSRFLPDIKVPQVLVSQDRAAMALMAAAFFDYPARQLKLVGITGTKGKTTTSFMVKAILEKAGYHAGLIGTTGYMVGDQWLQGSLTTPDPIELHRTFRLMADQGVTAVVMEVSAHALHMHRLEGLVFEAGVFTNLSQDHLDYFHTMEQYYASKRSFFSTDMVKNAAVNLDDDAGLKLLDELSMPHSSFAICTNADIFARDIEISEEGVDFALRLWNEQQYRVHLNMMGMFNVYNALAATAAALILGIAPEVICAALGDIKSVPGRAEVLDTHTPYKIVLDYSHSPDALVNILSTVKSFARGKVFVVFGCGGDRDQLKRPLMGRVAGELADYSILTSDNPRTEAPMKIIDAIEKGISATGAAYEVVEDRRLAIKRAMELAHYGDYIVLAGKGHETYQEINGVKKPFDEKKIVRELLGAAREANQ